MAASKTASQTGQINRNLIWASIEFRTRRAIAFAPLQTASHATELGHLGSSIRDIYPATLFACARVNGRRLRAP